MTSKEKALELVHRYDLFQTHIEGFSFDDAKNCALIAVDELSKNCYTVMKPFWNEVKQEIEKL